MTTREVIESDVMSGFLQSWLFQLEEENKSPNTRKAYRESIKRMVAFFKSRGMPLDPVYVTREHVQEFIIDHLRTGEASTAALRYRSAALFFKWLVEEGEISESPMQKMKPPHVPESLPPVLTEDQIRKLIAVCEKDKSFEGLRDTAIVRIFFDAGLRLSELTGLMLWRDDEKRQQSRALGDTDLQGRRLYVVGKGNKPRMAAIGAKTVRALDRYMRARARHKDASENGELWLGRHGPLKVAGVSLAVKRRAKMAGIEGMHVHLFRHTWSHFYLAAGGSETGLMKLAGWSSFAMVKRYGASAAAERAHAEHQRLRIADNF